MSGRPIWWAVLRSAWVNVRWPIIAALALLAVVLGYIGFDTYSESQDSSLSSWDKLYFSLQLFGLESNAVTPPIPASLQVARLLAPSVAAYAAISALATIFREQIAQTRVRWFARDHVVVCGLGRTGRLLVRGFREEGHRVVAIERDPNNTAIGRCREEGATVLVGDATDRSLLERAGLDRARYLFAVSDDDGVNARIAVHAPTLIGNRRGAPLTCYVQVLDVDLAELLDAEMASREAGTFRLEFFNPAERGAPALLNEYPPFDETGKTPFGPPHLLVVGAGQMGSRLVLHAARRFRALPEWSGERLRVTVVDRDARAHIQSLLLRYPQLEKVCDFASHVMDVGSPEFERAEFLFDAEGRHVTGVFVCLGSDAEGVAAGLRLRRRLRGRGVPIVVRTKQRGGLSELLGEASGEYEDLQVFGLLDLVCRPSVLLAGRTEILARAIHQQYIAERRLDGQTPETNPSMVSWEELPEHLKESNRRQADNIGIKLRAVGCGIESVIDWEPDPFTFTPEEIESLARMEHERWCTERESDGWTYAPEKNVSTKKTPYLVPYDELPDDVKDLDRATLRGMPSFLAKAGFRIVRVR